MYVEFRSLPYEQRAEAARTMALAIRDYRARDPEATAFICRGSSYERLQTWIGQTFGPQEWPESEHQRQRIADQIYARFYAAIGLLTVKPEALDPGHVRPPHLEPARRTGNVIDISEARRARLWRPIP